MTTNTEFFAIFLDEAGDILEKFERACLDLETNQSPQVLDEMFRAAHNLKGGSRLIGLTQLSDFVHRVEDLIELVIKGALIVAPELLSTFLEVHGLLHKWLIGLRESIDYCPEFAELMGRVDLYRELGREAPAGSLKPVDTKKVSASPVVAESKSSDLPATRESDDPLEQQRNAWSEDPVQSVEGRAPEKSKAEQRVARADETIRISSHKLDELIQLFGELSIHQGIIYEARKTDELDSRSAQHAMHLSYKIAKELHTKALTLRMQPLYGLFQKLERTVRDVARTQGKKIRVALEGVDVELDKTVIEQIADPLMHIVRNAVDHGIEDPELRVALGKPAEAEIRLVAVQDSAGVRLTVGDDGRGLDEERIKSKALEKGLIRPDAVITSEQIRKLIFLPGFSTSEKVTDISGRGVGMDVVMSSVQSLRGQLDVDSVAGKGTSISIVLPTSLSIVDALVVKVKHQRYAIPMQELTEIIDLDSYTVEHSGNKGLMISLRGEVVPVEALADYMPTLPGQGRTVASSDGDHGVPALLVREGVRAIAFKIDTIVSQQQVVVRPLSDQLAGLPGFSGCTILGDGEPGMIVSLPEVARKYFSMTERRGKSV